MNKWHQVLDEMCSMELALPGAIGLFSQIHEAFCYFKGKRVTLSKSVHEALAYFCWIDENVSNLPTHIYELFPTT